MSSFFSGGLAGCRNHFPALKDPESIICDGAAGSQVVIIIIKISYLVKISLQCQVPSLVVEKMANHLQRFDDCYDDDGDIYIMMKFLSVCMYVRFCFFFCKFLNDGVYSLAIDDDDDGGD